jgi:hypothetical protein
MKGSEQLISIIKEYHPNSKDGIRKFKELLEINKHSTSKADIISLFFDFSNSENFTIWINRFLEKTNQYSLKPFEKSSETIDEEYMYRKGFRQGFTEAYGLIKNSTDLQTLKKQFEEINSWSVSRFIATGITFEKISESEILRSKLEEFIKS